MKRSRLFVVVGCATAVVGAATLWAVLTGWSSSGSGVVAAEPKPIVKADDSTAKVYAIESGPKREKKPYTYWSERITSPAIPAPAFRVHVKTTGEEEEFVFSDADVSGLLGLAEKLKGQKQSDAEVIRKTTVFWAAGECRLQRLVGDNEEWKRVDGNGPAPSLEMLSQMLKDVEAMKEAKPSVKW